jgi:restriction system protein
MDSGAGALYDGVPPYDKLLFPTIKALKALGGSGTIEEITNKVIELEKFPPSVATAMHLSHNMTALEYRLAWARTYLKRVGAVDNSERGVWTLTERGSTFTREDCDRVPAEVRKQDRMRRASEQAQSGDSEIDEQSVLSWKDELLGTLRKMPASAFERLSQRVLREAGFTKVEVKGKSGDGGIDGIGILRVNLVSFTILFQCKRYKDTVSPDKVRDFRGAMQGRCDKGLIITTGTFTAEAKKEATRDGAPAIDLIDGESLCDLLKQLRLGVAVKSIESVDVDVKWFESI